MRLWLALLLLASPVLAAQGPYPRIFYYSLNRGDGRPLLSSGATPPSVAIDLASTNNRARWGTGCLLVGPWGGLDCTYKVSARRDVPTYARLAHPKNKILGYFNMNFWFNAPSVVPSANDTTQFADFQRIMRLFNNSGESSWIYNSNTGNTFEEDRVASTISSGLTMNWSYHAFADSVANYLIRVANLKDTTGVNLFDGFFFDSIFRTPGTELGGGVIDLTRTGSATAAALDTATSHELTLFFQKIRRSVPAGFQIWGNSDTRYDGGFLSPLWGFDGQMQEGMPGGALDGTLIQNFDTAYVWVRNPTTVYKVLKGERAAGTPYDANNMKAARYVLGVACLGDAWANIFRANNDFAIGYYDEYSVNLNPLSVKADTSGANIGWLGKPRGVATTVGTTNGTAAIYRREFENGVVYVNPGASSSTVLVTPSVAGDKYRFFNGVTNTTGNTGANVIGPITVAAKDAVFLAAINPCFCHSGYQ